jgi:endonuclease YncB( thermonuclease family)
MRLAHYAAPEIKGPERPLGLIAKQKLEELLSVGTIVTIQSHKTEKYGRWLAEVSWNGSTLADYLVSLGYGVRYDIQRDEKNPTFDPHSLPAHCRQR